MNSKDKGNIAESIILSEFTKRGAQVAIPFGDNARYDLIADFNNKLNRIQVKYCGQITENNSVLCVCSSSKNHTTNKHYDTYENQIDYFAFYIEEWNISLLVPMNYIGNRKSITFRKEETNKVAECHLIENFLFDKILNIKKEEKVMKDTTIKQNKCIDCGTEITNRAKRCPKCEPISRIVPLEKMPVTREELKQLIRIKPFTQIGLQFQMSDNAVRKWCKKFNLPYTKTEINKYSDEEWRNI